MRRVKEYFHWLLVIAPLLSILIAFFLDVEEKVIEFILIPASVLINLLIVWLKSSFNANEEQNLIRTFLTDDLSPNKFGKPLAFQTKLVIVEDEVNHGSFIKGLDRQFKSKTESKERNLILVPFACDASGQDKQIRKLHPKIEGAHAVVIVRTKEMEQKPWMYKAIDSWAYERSDVPILFTELGETDRLSSIPDKYFSIPDDPKSLPWRLLQRANERGFAWRTVAGFNRLIATNCIILVVMGFSIGHFLITHKEAEKKGIIREMFNGMAQETKYQYIGNIAPKEGNKERSTLSKDDLEVSYWIKNQGKIRQIAATENRRTHKQFDHNKQSAIGCGFVLGNHVTEWSNGYPKVDNRYPIKIWNAKDEILNDPEAEYFDEDNRKMTSIVCISYHEENPEQTVGICIFTESGKNIFGKDYRDFLRKRARDFFYHVRPLLERKELIPLVQ